MLGRLRCGLFLKIHPERPCQSRIRSDQFRCEFHVQWGEAHSVAKPSKRKSPCVLEEATVFSCRPLLRAIRGELCPRASFLYTR
ncbi:unnamed protein product [Agarophyton chilense]